MSIDSTVTQNLTGTGWRISDAHGLCIETDDRVNMVADFSPDSSEPGWSGQRTDAEFICYARNNWDRLVQERDALRERVQQLESRESGWRRVAQRGPI